MGFLYGLAFSLVLSTNPYVSNCLYLVSVSLIRYDYGLDYEVEVCFSKVSSNLSSSLCMRERECE